LAVFPPILANYIYSDSVITGKAGFLSSERIGKRKLLLLIHSRWAYRPAYTGISDIIYCL
jgi:hypothetical protein